MFGFLLGAGTFPAIAWGNKLRMRDAELARICSGADAPTRTVLTSGAGIVPVGRARALALTVNEISCLN